MKKSIKYLWLMLLSVAVVSCEEYYESPLEQEVGLSDIFATEDGARSYINDAYLCLPHKFNHNSSDVKENGIYLYKTNIIQQHMLASISDEAICGRNLSAVSVYADNQVSATYWDAGTPANQEDFPMGYYAYIRKCLTYIENVGSIPNVSQSFVTTTTAEAKALMAYFYFELMKRYGSMPWITKTYVGNEDDLSSAGKRPALKDYVANLDALIAEAIEGLPESYANVADQGKLTKAVAYFLRSRVWLWAASPLFNKRNDADYAEAADHKGRTDLNYAESYDASLWTTAATHTKAAIDYCEGLGIKLVNTGNPIDDYNTATYSLTDNTEYILFTRRVASAALGTLFYNRHMPVATIIAGVVAKASADSNAVAPTQEFINRYRRASDGELLVDDPYDIDDSELVAHYVNNENPWECLEPRFHASTFYDGLTVSSSIGSYTFPAEPTSGSDYWSSGYCMRKYIPDEFVNATSTSSVSVDMVDIVMRISELYLNYAEILCENNDLSSAIVYVKKTMERAGLPVATMSFPSTQDELREIIRNERAVEHAYESIRYFDCKRWLRGDLIASKKHGVRQDLSSVKEEYEADSNNTISYPGEADGVGYIFSVIGAANQYTLYTFIPRQYLWPIPQEEIRKDYGFVQNPGYEI